MMSSKNNRFTAGDIERYHSGKMSPEERHALEKAALDDPFLAEALEGYAFTPAASEDMDALRSRLHERTRRRKTVPLFGRYQWLGVAAMVLFLAGAGWLVYAISERQQPEARAMQKEPSAKGENPVQAPVTRVDTTASLPPPTLPGPSGRPAGRIVNANTVQEKKGRPAIPPGPATNAGLNDQVAVIKMEEKPETTLTLREADLGKAPAPDTRTMSRAVLSEKRIVPTDSGVAPSTPPSAVADRVPQDSGANVNIVLQRIPGDSASVMVIARNAPVKTANLPIVIIDTLEPAQGYVHFDDYVAENLKMPAEVKDKTLSGEVQLSFEVNDQGQPVNITVVRSLCEKCDQEAIRLLKEGPKWIRKKNKKGKITIRF